MVVDTSTSVPIAQVNMSLPYVQTGGSNVSMSYIQIGGNNVSMSYGQGMSTSTTRPNIKSTAIPYGDNQLTDPNLWNGFFSPISIFKVDNLWAKILKI